MKLERDERSILASFAHGPEAEAALRALREAGYSEVQMDRIAEAGYKPDKYEAKPAIAGKESSLVNAVLKPGQLDDESRILLGATPEASGMAAGDTLMRPFLVTLVTNEAGIAPAVKILQEHGGRV